MDCSLPGSSVYGIFQARVLEWDAIAFYPAEVCSNCNPGYFGIFGNMFIADGAILHIGVGWSFDRIELASF